MAVLTLEKISKAPFYWDLYLSEFFLSAITSIIKYQEIKVYKIFKFNRHKGGNFKREKNGGRKWLILQQ